MSRAGACIEEANGEDEIRRFKMMFYMKIFISLLSFLHSLALDVHRFLSFLLNWRGLVVIEGEKKIQKPAQTIDKFFETFLFYILQD